MENTLFSCISEAQASVVETQPFAELRIGSTALLSCAGNERGTVYWNKGDNPSTAKNLVFIDSEGEKGGPGFDEGLFDMDNNHSLVIRNVSTRTEGRYYCEAASTKTYELFRGYTDVTVYGTPLFHHCSPPFQLHLEKRHFRF